MASLNKIMLIGNVGTDPEMRYTPNGNPVTSFRMAVSRRYTASGERREETEWFTVEAWNQLAEQVNQYLMKGRRAYVEGRFRSRSFVGNDGQTRFVNEVVANRVLFLDRRSDMEEGSFTGDVPARSTQDRAEEVSDVEELPW
jgi:single-strand DNA-binding protein